MSRVDFHSIALDKFIELKGKEFVLKNKEFLYPTWNIKGEIAEVFISLANELDTNGMFDAKGNLCVDETKSAREIFRFKVNLTSGECEYIQ